MLIDTFDEFAWKIKLLLIQTNVDCCAAFGEMPHAGEEGMVVVIVVVGKITTVGWGAKVKEQSRVLYFAVEKEENEKNIESRGARVWVCV